VTNSRIGGADNRNAARQCGIKQAFQEAIARAAETQVHHLSILVEGELECLCQGKGAANSRVIAPRGLPTSPECHQFRLRRYSRDADAIVGSGGDDSRNRGPVLFRDVWMSIDEISRQRHSSGKIRMIELYSSIDLRD